MIPFPKTPMQLRTAMMGALIFLTVVGYDVMRGMKKTIILTSSTAGAAYIPFVKTTLVMPGSVLIGALYLLLRHRYGITTAYYLITTAFLIYFLLFTYYLSPNLALVTPSPQWLHDLQTAFPHFRFLIGLIAIWPTAFYYVAAELWGTYTLVVLFWQIAHELYTTNEASVAYPTFLFIRSISIIIASFTLEWLSLADHPLQTCTLTICTLGILMMGIVFLLDRLFKLNTHSTAARSAPLSSKKKSTTLTESLQLTFASPQVLHLGICLFSFGMLVNFFELSFDHTLSLHHSTPQALLAFQSWFTRAKGILCILANLVSPFLLRRFGWLSVALITPAVCIASANLFLLTLCQKALFQHYLPDLVMTNYVISLGCMLLVITYVCKFSFFDSTRELAFTTLPNTIKASAKAVADGICGRAGKSGSSCVQAVLISLTAAQSVTDITHYLLFFSLILSVFWLWSMFRLNQSYTASLAQHSSMHPEATQSEQSLTEPGSIKTATV